MDTPEKQTPEESAEQPQNVVSQERIGFHNKVAQITEGAVRVPLAIIQGTASAAARHAGPVTKNIFEVVGGTAIGIYQGLRDGFRKNKNGA